MFFLDAAATFIVLDIDEPCYMATTVHCQYDV